MKTCSSAEYVLRVYFPLGIEGNDFTTNYRSAQPAAWLWDARIAAGLRRLAVNKWGA
jgi:hypothetical protein